MFSKGQANPAVVSQPLTTLASPYAVQAKQDTSPEACIVGGSGWYGLKMERKGKVTPGLPRVLSNKPHE